MPPRQTPPPAGKPRRRPSPAMPGSWIWLVILGTVLLMLLVNMANDRKKVDWSDFYRLATSDKYSKNISKIILIGKEKIAIEVKSADDLPPSLQEKVKGAKEFWTPRIQGDESSKQLDELLSKLVKENPEL